MGSVAYFVALAFVLSQGDNFWPVHMGNFKGAP